MPDQRTCSEAKNKSQVSSINKSKFTVTGVNEQLKSIRKLEETSDFLDSREINNNTILNSNHGCDTSKTIGMADPKRKVNENKVASSSKSSAPINSLLDQDTPDTRNLDESNTSQMPSYASLFAPRTASGVASRGALRRQSELEPQYMTSIENLSNKKLGSFNYNLSKDHQGRADDEDVDEDDLDERMPFNSSLSKLRGHRMASPEPRKQSPSYNKHTLIPFEDKCELSKQNHPQTKISFCGSRPPSFNTCQTGYGQAEIMAARKVDFCSSQNYNKCDCNNCCRKFNSMVDGSFRTDFLSSSKYPKTYSLHLVLKSIILILITLLLLMLFFGILMASHHLPLALDRMMNTAHSFNVTIAG